MGTGSFPGVKCGRGVLLTTHHLLVPPSCKSRAVTLPTLWATPGLWRDHFTFTFIFTFLKIPAYGRQQFIAKGRRISASPRGLTSHSMPSLVYFWRQIYGALTRADHNFHAKTLEGGAPKLLKRTRNGVSCLWGRSLISDTGNWSDCTPVYLCYFCN